MLEVEKGSDEVEFPEEEDGDKNDDSNQVEFRCHESKRLVVRRG